MAALNLDRELPEYQLASALRCAFSGVVAGNVKAFGIEQVQRHGPYKLSGDRRVLDSMDRLLRHCVQTGRMKLDGRNYAPCYQLEA